MEIVFVDIPINSGLWFASSWSEMILVLDFSDIVPCECDSDMCHNLTIVGHDYCNDVLALTDLSYTSWFVYITIVVWVICAVYYFLKSLSWD